MKYIIKIFILFLVGKSYNYNKLLDQVSFALPLIFFFMIYLLSFLGGGGGGGEGQ